MHTVPEVVVLAAIVGVLSVVQSIFGIGVLLLGTPILLLTGKDFIGTLWTLLPASIAISALQLGFDKGLRVSALRTFVVFAIPTLTIGLLIALSLGNRFKIEVFVGLMLIVGAILRISTSARRLAVRWLAAHENETLAGIGLVHGLTNMGGGLLSLYASVRHFDKHDIRQYIAMGYLTFAFAQLAVLASTSYVLHHVKFGLIYAAISGATFLAIGRGVFKRIASSHYNILFSGFEIACGSVLIAKWLQGTLSNH